MHCDYHTGRDFLVRVHTCYCSLWLGQPAVSVDIRCMRIIESVVTCDLPVLVTNIRSASDRERSLGLRLQLRRGHGGCFGTQHSADLTW